jgi:hypothetical protein
MNFIEKLIEETINGNLDFVWKYNDGTQMYTFKIPKHPLNETSFSLAKDPGLIVLPNGCGVDYSKELLKQLRDAVDQSIIRTADTIMRDYVSGEIKKQLEEDKKKEEASKSENNVNELEVEVEKKTVKKIKEEKIVKEK